VTAKAVERSALELADIAKNTLRLERPAAAPNVFDKRGRLLTAFHYVAEVKDKKGIPPSSLKKLRLHSVVLQRVVN